MKQTKRGFSLAELVVIIGITAIIASLTMFSFRGFSNYQMLEKETDVVHSLIENARLQALNSKNFADFGMRFSTTSITLFQGSVYAVSDSNTVHSFPSGVEISSILLTGNSTDVYFENITGEPSATGTVTFRLTSSGTTTKTILIHGTGLTEVQ